MTDRFSIDQAVGLARSNDRHLVDQGLDQLALLAAAGSQPALAALLRSVVQHRLAERPVRAVLIDAADVDDAVQATLITVAGKISGFEGRSLFRTWLDRVARNEAKMVLRRRTRKSEPTGEPVPEADRSARRLSSLVVGELEFEELLGRLSAEHREIMVLREDQALSYEEIGNRLGLPVGTVRSRLNRARRVLSELILVEAA